MKCEYNQKNNMVKREGCKSGQVKINGRCYDLKGSGNITDLLVASNCYDKLAVMKDYMESGKDIDSKNFKEITRSVIGSCVLPDEYYEYKSMPFHSESINAVVKRSRREPHKGVLPSGHRGDFIKLRNCHGTMTFWSS